MSIKLGINITSLAAQRLLGTHGDGLSRALERLSSGLRINRPSDDPAGLAMASKLEAETRIYAQAIRNANDAMSVLTIADGALAELSNITHRQGELAQQAANGVLTFAQRKSITDEANALAEEFNRIVETTKFNGQKILTAETQSLNVQLGRTQDDRVSFELGAAFSRTVGAGTFGSAIILDGAANPIDLAVGDFNGDGNQDIVGAANQSDQLLVYLGNGDGNFKAAETYATGVKPYQVTVGDFDNDGRLDMISGDHDDWTITYFQGNGDGTFSAGSTFQVGSQIHEQVAGDVNGDGNLDIVSVGYQSNNLRVLVGNGDGTFEGAQTYLSGVGAEPYGIDLADVDRDGDLDAVVTRRGDGAVAIHLNNGDGTYAAPTVYGVGLNPVRSTFADYNGDGWIDFVTPSNDAVADVNFYLNNGDGTFSLSVSQAYPGGGGTGPSLTDINGDGRADLLFNRLYSNITQIYINNGNGTFLEGVESGWAAGVWPSEVAVADFNNDGAPDIAAGLTAAGVQDFGVRLQNTTETTGMPQLSMYTEEEARAALSVVAQTRERITAGRANIGSSQARLNTSISFLGAMRDNYAEAVSRIMDADVAQEVANMVRLQILQQATAAILTQANQNSKLVLQLLGE